MLLFTSFLAKHSLTFTPLNQCPQYLPLVARWAEEEWGYIRNKGVEYRREVMEKISQNVYVGMLGGQPVAMFALLEHTFDAELIQGVLKLPHARQLMYVYVEQAYRGLGFSKQIITEAKRLAIKAHVDLIVLDTLKPSLNRLYEKQGASIVCEGQLFSYPTDVLSMTLDVTKVS